MICCVGALFWGIISIGPDYLLNTRLMGQYDSVAQVGRSEFCGGF